MSCVKKGLVAMGILLLVYGSIVVVVSGSAFATVQFFKYWYFIMSVAIGFGIQIGLYQHLRALTHTKNGEGKLLAVTGTTSTLAMISCCAHYLVSILPVLGVSIFVSVIDGYQVELFWVGILFNVVGIAYMMSRIEKIKQQN